jgi:hypothetical protein
MQQAKFKRFIDIRTRLSVVYWHMNNGEMFITCDSTGSGLKPGDDNKIEDYGCTFATTGNGTFQVIESEIITDWKPGDVFNRRPLKSTIIRSLEDNSRWCYVIHLDSVFQINPNNPSECWQCPNPKILIGEQIKVSADEIVTLSDDTQDIYIVNPICDDEIEPISYKLYDSETFTNLKYGKFLKIRKGKSYDIKSNMDIYIPKISFINK